MEYTISGRLLPIMLNNSIKKALKKYYENSEIKNIVKNTKEKLSLEDFDELIQTGLKNCFLLKLKMKKVDYLAKKYIDKLHKNSKWAKENQEKFPWTWQLQIPINQNSGELYYEFTNCGLCKLCSAENVPEIIGLMCKIDYLLLNFSNFKLLRNKTLAQGNDCCDFRILRSLS